MSGRKNHFIQRLLLKGFAVDPSARIPQLWVYPRGRKPFKTALEGYGAERDFYGDPELDAGITAVESKQSNGLIHDLRTGTDREVDARTAAAFAVQVFARSKNLRRMVADGIEPMMSRASAKMQEPEFQVRMLLAEIGRNPTLMAQAMLSGMGTEEFARSRVRKSLPAALGMLKGSLANVRDAVAEQQNRTLRERLDFRGSRRDELESLHWFRISLDEVLILGDSVVFAELADGRFKPATEPGDRLGTIWLPMGTHVLLAGTRATSAPTIDAASVNQGAASCSYDAFCSDDGPDAHSELTSLIRTQTFSLEREQMERIVAESLARLV